MNRLTLGLCAVVFVSSGCVETALNPSDKVSVTGKALNQDKSPLVSTPLALTRSANSACLVMNAFQTPKTDASGAYTLSLTGADTQNGDIARCFTLATPAGEKGALSSVNFLMQVTAVAVPDVQLWNGNPAAAQTATGATLTFADLSATHGLNNLVFNATVKGTDGTAWQKFGATSPVAFSDEVLEDFTASAFASTSNTVKGSGTTFTQSFVSDTVAVPSHSKVPASRGASCQYAGAPAACPLTDGKLVTNVFSTTAGNVSVVTITLSSPKILKKAILRNLSVSGAASLELGGSVDGTTFTKIADVDNLSLYQELGLSGATAVTAVQLRGTADSGQTLTFNSLDELSLFE